MTAVPAHPDTVADAPPSPLRRLLDLRKNYLFRVVMQGLLTVWAVTTFTFFLIRLMPGDPFSNKVESLMIQQNLTYEQAYSIAQGLFNFDPNEPVFQQYATYMSRLVQGDLGQSITSAGTPVITQIAKYLPWTLFSVGLALTISFTFGVLIGLAMGYWRGGIFDNIMTVIASFFAGIPDYILALLFVLILGVQFKLFNVGEFRGGSDPNLTPGFTLEYIGSLFKYALFPVTIYVASTIGTWILSMKSSTISTLGEDYITVAQARGLSQRRILSAYIGRNAMLPLITRLAISIGFVVGGSIAIEQIFEYPGLGRQLLRAITTRDYTTMQGIFLVITIAVVVANVLSDLALGLLDPRVRVDKEGKL
jgi:peptide/nickel transport system permease protein